MRRKYSEVNFGKISICHFDISLVDDNNFFREFTIILDPKDFILILTLSPSRKSLSLLTERTLGREMTTFLYVNILSTTRNQQDGNDNDSSHSISEKNITNARIMLKITQPSDFFEADLKLFYLLFSIFLAQKMLKSLYLVLANS